MFLEINVDNYLHGYLILIRYMVSLSDVVCRRLVAGALPDRNLPVSVVPCSSAGKDSKDQQQTRRHCARQRRGSESLAHQPSSDTEPEYSTSGAIGVILCCFVFPC